MLGSAVSRTEQTALPWMALRGKRRRPLEDRFAMRFPTLATQVNVWLTEVTLRMPRRWRLRQLLFEWAAWRAYNAIGRRDLDLLRTINHADVIWDLSRWEWPEESFYHGRDGAVRFNEHWLAQFSELNFDVASVEEIDEGGVFFVHVHLRGIGRGSGVEVERDDFGVVRFRDGLVWRGAYFRNRADAIDAAREQANALAPRSA
jgi:ketosteroid isomerase-like protein